MRKNHQRVDYVPSAPIRRALREWLRDNDLAARWDGRNGDRDGYLSPLEILAERVGMSKDAVWRHASGDRGYEYMEFDVADALLCAADRPNRWWQDPELAPYYEGACKGADRIYPIAVAA